MAESTLKITMMGQTNVGKTLLMNDYVGPEYDNQKHVRVQIWDWAGQERFRNIGPGNYHGAHGICLVYDVTNKESFETVTSWLRSGDNQLESYSKILVANKVDLNHLAQVSNSEGQELAHQFKLPFMETSAKTGYQVAEMFDILISDALIKMNKLDATPRRPNTLIDLVSSQLNDLWERTRRTRSNIF